MMSVLKGGAWCSGTGAGAGEAVAPVPMGIGIQPLGTMGIIGAYLGMPLLLGPTGITGT